MSHQEKILIVDDEPGILKLLSAYLLREKYRVQTADTGNQGLLLFHSWQPELVILDLMLPDISGEHLCQAIRKEGNIPILMLTAKAGEQNVINGLAIGADDYMTKPFSPREVVARIRTLFRRLNPGSMPRADILLFDADRLQVHLVKQNVVKDSRPVSLTSLEYRLLAAMACSPGHTFTREELIGKTMNEDYDGYDRTIDVHIKNLRQKIEDNPKEPRYILTVYGVGYKMAGI